MILPEVVLDASDIYVSPLLCHIELTYELLMCFDYISCAKGSDVQREGKSKVLAIISN